MLWQVTEQDAELRTRAFKGLRRFQQIERPHNKTGGRLFAQHARASLIQYAPESAARTARRPVLFVPSLINPPNILDLAPDNSMLRFLCAQGHDVYRVDWGSPDTSERNLDLAGHVTRLLLPLIDRLPAPPVLVGYCLGGTLAVAAASLYDCPALVTIAAPWDFAAYPEAFRTQSQSGWTMAEGACEQLGLVPMEVLQGGFWSLDPQRTIRKYADFGDLPEGDRRIDAFVRLEDWANEGAPLTLAAGRDLLLHCYGHNMTGSGAWTVDGQVVDPAAFLRPSLTVLSTQDRIVPAASAPAAGEQLPLDLGHVGMIVSGRAPEQLWRPLSEWLIRQNA